MRNKKLLSLSLKIILVLFLFSFNIYAQVREDLFREGTTLIKNGQYDTAINKLEKCLKIDANQIGCSCNLAIAYAFNQEIDKAIKEIEKIIDKEYSPSKGILLFNLANLYKEKGDVEKAEKNYNDSLYFLPYFAQPYLQLGSLYWKRKDEKKAEEYFSIGNSMDSFMPDILPSTEEEKTIGYTRLLKTEKPTPLFYLYHSPAWHISLAINYMKKSELENSRSEIDKAIAVLDKDSPLQSDKMAMVEVYIYKGNIYLIEKNLDKALEENLKAYDIDSSHLGAIANLGMIYFLKEDYDAAVKYCRMALGINPDFYPALILKQALTEKGKM